MEVSGIDDDLDYPEQAVHVEEEVEMAENQNQADAEVQDDLENQQLLEDNDHDAIDRFNNLNQPGVLADEYINPDFPSTAEQQEQMRSSSHQSSSYYDFTNHVNHVQPHIATSVDIYRYFVEFGAPRELYERVIKRVNAYIGNRAPKLCSHYLAGKSLESEYPIDPDTYHMCQKGCYMFYDETEEHCPHCQRPRFLSPGIPARTTKQLSLATQLALLVAKEETRCQLQYPFERQPASDGLVSDIFDSPFFDAVQRLQGYDQDTMNIYLGLFTDDFQPFHHGKSTSVTLLHIVVLNFDPSIRMEQKNMLQVAVVPGPKTEDLSSFMKPMLDDLQQLATDGINVKLDNGCNQKVAHRIILGLIMLLLTH